MSLSDIKKIYSIESPKILPVKESPPTNEEFLLEKNEKELKEYLTFYGIQTNISKVKKILKNNIINKNE